MSKMKSFTKARIKDGLSSNLKNVLRTNPEEKHVRGGIGGASPVESVPGFNEVSSEHVISNKHNAFIVLGRDRPGSRLSGYGGRGDTHCASIDLVAGRMGYLARARSERGEKIIADPNFKTDAARIYISQKTDIDKNFQLARGSFPMADTKSAVAIKADGVRIIAREGMKLITGPDEKSSQGSEVTKAAYGINLIANNDDSDLQPIPKGNNLAEALVKVIDHLDKVTGIIDGFLMSQIKFNTALGAHVHISPFLGIPTTPSILASGAAIMSNTEKLAIVKSSLVSEKINLVNLKINYLTPLGKSYINSFHNYSN
tara:strand:+ start:11628 stop:12569 length:942 start_codon:yes stop_codon:yes gene_type:complete